MAITRQQKTKQLQALEEKFKNAQGVAFVKFFGPSVEDVQGIRRELRSKGMSYTVIKKTLIALAAKNTNLAEFSPDNLDGSVAVIVSDSDEIAPAAEIKKMKKTFWNKESKTSKFDFAGAVFEGKLLDEKAAAILAETPTREESLAKIISMLRSGPQKIHGALTHGLRGIHAALKDAEKYATAG
jgi:large subunit ribosomal protein L10